MQHLGNDLETGIRQCVQPLWLGFVSLLGRARLERLRPCRLVCIGFPPCLCSPTPPKGWARFRSSHEEECRDLLDLPRRQFTRGVQPQRCRQHVRNKGNRYAVPPQSTTLTLWATPAHEVCVPMLQHRCRGLPGLARPLPAVKHVTHPRLRSSCRQRRYSPRIERSAARSPSTRHQHVNSCWVDRSRRPCKLALPVPPRWLPVGLLPARIP